MIVYLLRHGESLDDVEDAYGGIADYALSPSGKESAKNLASQLKDSGIQVLYSSPYRRATETAEVLRETLGCKIRQVEDLRERNSYGVLSGTTKSAAKEIFAHVLRTLKGKPGDYYSNELLPGAEPLDELFSRVRRALDWVFEDAKGLDVIGVVTHGNVTRAIYEQMLGSNQKIDLDHLAITELNWDNGQLHIQNIHGVSYGAPISRS